MKAYVILAGPTAMPDTKPVKVSIVAIAVLSLVHVPPAEASERVVVPLTQTLGQPEIAAGAGFTVAITKEMQPVV